MEDYAAYLAEEARSDVAALHQFRILYDEGRIAYHFFVEGEEDGLFYMPAARRHTNAKELYLYDCGGKKSVADVRESIKVDGYDLSKCLFFVDRDFDDILCSQVSIDEHTYITDGYPIENDISSVDCAGLLMSDVIGLSRADPEFKRIELALLNGFETFYHLVRPLTAWILAAKVTGCAPNLRNTTGLKGVVTFQQGAPVINEVGFSEFKRKVLVNGRKPSLASVIACRRPLKVEEAKQWVRGKYHIWFFQTYLISQLAETSARRKAAGGRALRIPSSLREGRIFELMGGRNSPPESLLRFFEKKLELC